MLLQGASQSEDLTAAHRSALKAYVFFLYWAAQQCEAEARDGGGPAAAAAGAAAGRSPRPPAAQYHVAHCGGTGLEPSWST